VFITSIYKGKNRKKWNLPNNPGKSMQYFPDKSTKDIFAGPCFSGVTDALGMKIRLKEKTKNAFQSVRGEKAGCCMIILKEIGIL